MSALIQPATLLLIILIGYLFKRFGILGAKDYHVVQVIEFDIVLPGAIIYSFATNPHQISLLLLSAFSLCAAAIPPLLVFLATRHRPVSDRAFLMLNSSGFNVGCFGFPMLQAFLGPAALVPAAMFDIGNNIMVAAGTNVLMQNLLHIAPGKTLAEQNAGDAPTLPRVKATDRDARRLQRRALIAHIIKGFVISPAFDTYILMVVLMLFNFHFPTWIAQVSQPFSAANAFCAMVMVGMLTDLPASKRDLKFVGEVMAWRMPCAIVFALAAWFLLPFDPLVREAAVMCCLAPTAIFATMFTDKVLGNAKLAGFILCLTAVVGTVMMSVAHLIIHM
ncbi:AEC family transporter [Bifidobacterium sp. ESL0763]|uniref:AEC family transporter n=1 Tax=Bifidobacterium sp. ESL0763 TaxID=2983227 RepID=UPI0023F65CF7|nr:AEC family transporter [Bifidobacterium sp. ESL0763]MDF7664337.1 AEC family transporter [Bifidobacterium sp. ESL0763]